MWELLGLDLESRAKGEASALNSTRDKFDSYDLGDRFIGAITGVSREQLLKRTQELENARLTQLYSPQAKQNKGRLGHFDSTYTGVGNKTIQQIESELETDNQRANAVEQTKATHPDFDPTTLPSTASAGTIIGAGNKATTEYNRSEANRKETKEDNRYEAGVRRAELAATRSNNLATAQLALSTMQANNQMQIAQMNNQLQMRKEDAREARLDRKDRMAAIQQMMAGLAQMGASIAI